MAFISNNEMGTRKLVSHACYLQSALQNMPLVYRRARRGLAKFPDCDTLVGMGLSGALVVPRVADKLKLNWAIVRKQGDGTHSTERIEGTIGERWVFFDDLISSGSTLAKTCQAIKDECRRYGFATTLLGALCYAPHRTYQREDLPLPEGFEPDYHSDTDAIDAEEARLARHRERMDLLASFLVASEREGCDTQDVNGNPVYAPVTIKDGLITFAEASRECEDYVRIDDLPVFLDGRGKTIEDIYNELTNQGDK